MSPLDAGVSIVNSRVETRAEPEPPGPLAFLPWWTRAFWSQGPAVLSGAGGSERSPTRRRPHHEVLRPEPGEPTLAPELPSRGRPQCVQQPRPPSEASAGSPLVSGPPAQPHLRQEGLGSRRVCSSQRSGLHLDPGQRRGREKISEPLRAHCSEVRPRAAGCARGRLGPPPPPPPGTGTSTAPTPRETREKVGWSPAKLSGPSTPCGPHRNPRPLASCSSAVGRVEGVPERICEAGSLFRGLCEAPWADSNFQLGNLRKLFNNHRRQHGGSTHSSAQRTGQGETRGLFSPRLLARAVACPPARGSAGFRREAGPQEVLSTWLRRQHTHV